MGKNQKIHGFTFTPIPTPTGRKVCHTFHKALQKVPAGSSTGVTMVASSTEGVVFPYSPIPLPLSCTPAPGDHFPNRCPAHKPWFPSLLLRKQRLRRCFFFHWRDRTQSRKAHSSFPCAFRSASSPLKSIDAGVCSCPSDDQQ